MMSRSESLPMTMETRGCLFIRLLFYAIWVGEKRYSTCTLQVCSPTPDCEQNTTELFSRPQMFQSTCCNVFAIVHSVEANLHHRVVSAFYRVRQIFSTCGNAQNS